MSQRMAAKRNYSETARYLRCCVPAVRSTRGASEKNRGGGGLTGDRSVSFGLAISIVFVFGCFGRPQVRTSTQPPKITAGSLQRPQLGHRDMQKFFENGRTKRTLFMQVGAPSCSPQVPNHPVMKVRNPKVSQPLLHWNYHPSEHRSYMPQVYEQVLFTTAVDATEVNV